MPTQYRGITKAYSQDFIFTLRVLLPVSLYSVILLPVFSFCASLNKILGLPICHVTCQNQALTSEMSF